MRWLSLVLAIAGCAQAGKDAVGGRPDGGIHVLPDSDPGHPPPDAADLPDAPPPPDAPPGQQTVTLAQTNNMTVAAGVTVACGNSSGTADNNWYRVFKLSDYGITNTFHVQQVSFMVDYAHAGAGGMQPAQVKVGTYGGTLDATSLTLSQITPVNAAQIMVPDGDATTAVPPPVTATINADIPAGSNLIVEIDLPNGEAAGNFFYIGSSSGGETHPGYIYSSVAACSISPPKSLASLNHADNGVLISVTGTH